jgi:hypothetical protein
MINPQANPRLREMPLRRLPSPRLLLKLVFIFFSFYEKNRNGLDDHELLLPWTWYAVFIEKAV